MRWILVIAVMLAFATAGFSLDPDKIIIKNCGLTKGGTTLEVELNFKQDMTIYLVTLLMPDGTQAPQEKNIDVTDHYEMHLAWSITGGSFPTGTYKLRFTGKSSLIKFTLDKEITI
jgi:hypothetical protein